MGSMKVHQLARGLCSSWDQHEVPSLTLGCKRLRPLAPKLITPTTPDLDLKSFIKPDSGPTKLVIPPSHHAVNKDNSPSPQHQTQQVVVETHPGGTRWNPTQEQIGILEMLYRGGMRTPNAQQIEQITAQLGKYGKIEGKNVFYWFQNHKARERQRQKQKRVNTLMTTHTQDQQDSPYRKKCRRWAFHSLQDTTIMSSSPSPSPSPSPSSSSSLCRQEDRKHTTLELFPLHPEGRS